MHPIERLRYVARAGSAGPSALAAEAAWALADLAEAEAPAVLPACRRLLDRLPGCGPLWWVAARVLSAGDPVAEAERCAGALETDPTVDVVHGAFGPDVRVARRGGVGDLVGADLVLVEVEALGPTGLVTTPSRGHLLEAARAAEVPVFVQSGVGRVLPPRLWGAMSGRLRARGAQSGAGALAEVHASAVASARRQGGGSLFDHRGVEQVVGPEGRQSLAVALARTDCPEPPELLEDA